ncbi:hypothetical protein H8356DRAFT_921977 [Neocallimastix lanati (nom. inval.)]|jgi:hypothetical protein|uniref:NOT2/NOT3/NOT5 C-terminal domain-containing protein n=1 Tax=Neocallimastix californiae TaxID=1754190 RepID=A0A1Y2EWI1_9FUNG|nr:hypothetical protein H8356DRAFT_921977 [Neocallimastix sp. JGI-2020a]ORY75185.1 hypothetical protein LY90DRAFT_665922 [Neocallimastix californiae]|eukprot:ORY75185.1 hypothetical protein LY90DRAFT_665922 [Neocallimastix californiae]
MSSKDLLNSRTPSSYSTVAGGHQEREVKKKAEFTADDFPALSNTSTRTSFDEHGMKKQIQYSVKAGSNHSSKNTSQVTSPSNSRSNLNLNQYQKVLTTSPKDEKNGPIIDSLINSTSNISLQSDSITSSGTNKQKDNKNDKYSINSLLDPKREENILNTGSDILSFGFDLNDKKIYPKFSSPFSNKPKLFPKNQLPTCFSLPQMPPPIITKIGVFSDETLFYIFYTMPKEAIQEAAAQELYNRNWRYHKKLGIWLAKELGSEDVVKGIGCEKGLYLYFDPKNWEKKKSELLIYYEQLEERGPVGISLYNKEEEENKINEANLNNIALMNMIRQGSADGINASLLNNMNMANRQILADQLAMNQFSFAGNNQMSPINNPTSQQQSNNNLFSVFGAAMNNPSVINQLQQQQQQNYLNQAGNNPGNINLNNINPLLGLNNGINANGNLQFLSQNNTTQSPLNLLNLANSNNNKGQMQNNITPTSASANINNNNLNKGLMNVNLPLGNLNSMNNVNLNTLKALSGMNMNGMGMHMNNMNLNSVNLAMNNNSVGK